MRLKDKVSIITGAGRGIGQATALKFAREGAIVIVCDVGQTSVDETVAAITADGGTADGFVVDVTKRAQIDAMVEAVMAKHGRIDTLVNNAGIVADAQLRKMSDAAFDRVIDVNLKGTWNCARAVVDIMVAQGSGVILNASSIVGIFGNFGQSNYAAAKLGVVGFMNALKHEGRKYNIHVNTIAPMALTRMTEDIMSEQIKPLVKPEFVTPMVAWFCAEENETSGDVIEAGAGYYARVQIMEAAGAVLGAGQVPTPEEVRDNYGRIADMSAAQPHDSANDVMRHLFRTLRPR